MTKNFRLGSSVTVLRDSLSNIRDADHVNRICDISIENGAVSSKEMSITASNARESAEKNLGKHGRHTQKIICGTSHTVELTNALISPQFDRRSMAVNQLARLTPRQYQIMELILIGMPNKNIAADLGISQRTVENHRAAIMKKTGSRSLSALVRLALTAVWSEAETFSQEVERNKVAQRHRNEIMHMDETANQNIRL
jgi:two-component system, chemotaxis family, CheB/CheR fusion protein